MKYSTKIRNVAIILFGIVSVLFLVFFIYIGLSENIAVYNAELSHSYIEVTDFSMEQIADDTAPAGIRTVYRWVPDASYSANSCLCFYVVHQYVEVYCDGELIYSLTADSDNRIGDSIGSNWVTFSLDPRNLGKEFTVILTPLFESMADYEPVFLIGSHFSIMFDQFTRDLPALFLSMMCIFVGTFIMAVQLYLIIRAKTRTLDMLFMGNFSILLGLWQITGIKSSPLLFESNPMVLGYITIGVLFLCSIPLLLFAGTFFHGKKSAFLWILSAAGSITAAVVLLLQVLKVADFREMLVVSHVMLLVTVCAIIAMALLNKKRVSGKHLKVSLRLLVLPAIGIVIDLILFYANGSSADLFFATLLAFLVYILIAFVASILETAKKAYTDSHTGLTNKVHWNELMNADGPVEQSTAIMMLDLNGLKQVNDTLGHDAGDKLILGFSNILANSLPKNSVICRWGGDEFAVMITDTNQKKVDKCITAIRQAVDDYNAGCDGPPIFYAVGYALSSDHPGLSRMDLLSKADAQMYVDKRKWYSEKKNPDRE